MPYRMKYDLVVGLIILALVVIGRFIYMIFI